MHNRHCEEEFLEFMNLVDSQLPRETQIQLVLDNLATNKTPQVRNWFARRPHYVLHLLLRVVPGSIRSSDGSQRSPPKPYAEVASARSST
jgi:hypothetical protein